jgi:hypothetical protein
LIVNEFFFVVTTCYFVRCFGDPNGDHLFRMWHIVRFARRADHMNNIPEPVRKGRHRPHQSDRGLRHCHVVDYY